MKTALITGSSRGIGAAIADVLAKDGWRVVLTGSRENAEARARAQALGGEYIPADLSDETQTAALFSAAGDIDALVCCAGKAHYGLLQDMTDDVLNAAAESLGGTWHYSAQAGSIDIRDN